MFSITTMASSTTKPVTIVSAISERLSMRIAEQVHHAESSHQRDRHRHGWNHVAQTFRRKTKITKITSTTVISSVI